MKKIDEMIAESLVADEQALLAQAAQEPGYLKQAADLFRGRLGWVMALVGTIQLLLFLGAMIAFWRMFVAVDLMTALRWGVGTVVLVQLSALLRSFMGMHFEANRMIREIKRLELRIVQASARAEGHEA